nr:MAG TPA: hypothetical protein [Caudoviricetes sp.]
MLYIFFPNFFVRINKTYSFNLFCFLFYIR